MIPHPVEVFSILYQDSEAATSKYQRSFKDILPEDKNLCILFIQAYSKQAF